MYQIVSIQRPPAPGNPRYRIDKEIIPADTAAEARAIVEKRLMSGKVIDVRPFGRKIVPDKSNARLCKKEVFRHGFDILKGQKIRGCR